MILWRSTLRIEPYQLTDEPPLAEMSIGPITLSDRALHIDTFINHPARKIY